METILFVLLQTAVLAGIIYGLSLIIKIIKRPSKVKRVYRLIPPIIGIVILSFYLVKHLIEFYE